MLEIIIEPLAFKTINNFGGTAFDWLIRYEFFIRTIPYLRPYFNLGVIGVSKTFLSEFFVRY